MSQVNAQITDAVSQANVKVVAEAPAMAMGHIYQTLAHSTGLMFQNAVNAQQQLNMASQAATVQGASLLLTVPTAEDSVAASKLNRSDLAEIIAALQAVVDKSSAKQEFVSETKVTIDDQ